MRSTLLAITAILIFSPVFGEGPASRSDPDFVPDQGPIKHLKPSGVCPPAVEVTTPLPFIDFGDSCSGTNTVTDYTSGAGLCPTGDNAPTISYPGEESIYEITLTAGNTVSFTLDLTGSKADLSMFLVKSCGDGSTCVSEAIDNLGAGVSETIDADSLSAGTYYLYIDSYYAAGDARSCGDYTLSVDGTLPVELLEFEIE